MCRFVLFEVKCSVSFHWSLMLAWIEGWGSCTTESSTSCKASATKASLSGAIGQRFLPRDPSRKSTHLCSLAPKEIQKKTTDILFFKYPHQETLLEIRVVLSVLMFTRPDWPDWDLSQGLNQTESSRHWKNKHNVFLFGCFVFAIFYV